MPRGRPKGSTNKWFDHPENLEPPENWSTKISEISQTRHAVQIEGGPKSLPVSTSITCIKVFRLLWNEKFDDHIVKRTNKRSSIKIDRSDLHRFLLAGIVMCQNIRTDYKKHWASDVLFENNVVKSIMARDRFRKILHHLHPKAQKLVDLANMNFQRYWTPYPHIAIDEGLVCFKGRFQHRVHIRGKPDATGLKIYCLADEKGYLYAFDLYQGEHSTIIGIVEKLVGQLPDFKYKLYLDSWYGSSDLANDLTEYDLYFTMACGKNKPASLFHEYLDKDLRKKQCRYLQSSQDENIIACSYNDRAKCHFISNQWRPAVTLNNKNQKIPSIVEDYRQHMGMVDRVDRSALKATWPHRNKKWSMAFFWYILGLCVSNAHKIYKVATSNNASLTFFLYQLTTEWMQQLNIGCGAPRKMLHLLEKRTSRGRCEVCRHIDRNIAKTRLFCIKCKVHLHSRCFAKHHSKILKKS